MGKRKKTSSKPAGPKKRESLPTSFTCLFCNHEDAVTIKMDKKRGIGFLRCNNCTKDFQSTINYLSAPVDVFSDWIDACEAVAQEDAEQDHVTEEDKQFSTYANARPRANAKAGDDDEDGGLGDDDDDDY